MPLDPFIRASRLSAPYVISALCHRSRRSTTRTACRSEEYLQFPEEKFALTSRDEELGIVSARTPTAGHHGPTTNKPTKSHWLPNESDEVGKEPRRSNLSVPRFAPWLSTRAKQLVLVVAVTASVLSGALPQVQELISSLIVLNAVWLAREAVKRPCSSLATEIAARQRSIPTSEVLGSGHRRAAPPDITG